MITLYPTAKTVAGGFIPMITLRAAKGRMIGSKVPQGTFQTVNTYADRDACQAVARQIAERVAQQHADVLRVAA